MIRLDEYIAFILGGFELPTMGSLGIHIPVRIPWWNVWGWLCCGSFRPLAVTRVFGSGAFVLNGRYYYAAPNARHFRLR